MSDLDALRQRGITIRVLVDGSGVAIGGSKTLTELCAEGVSPICQTDASGAALDGSTLTQTRSRGIQQFCSVGETGVDATSGLTVSQLAARGVSGGCVVDSSGIAQSGTATLTELRQRGIPAFCPVDETGTATTLSVGSGSTPTYYYLGF